MRIRILIQQQIDIADYNVPGETDTERVEYLIDRFVEDIHTLANNSIVREQVEVEYL